MELWVGLGMQCLKPTHRAAWRGTPASAADSGHRGHGYDGTVYPCNLCTKEGPC